MDRADCIRCGRRVGWISFGANSWLTVLKVVVGIIAGSKAVLADALHSSTNILTAFAIFIGRRLTGKPVDEGHPYGHGKVEFLAAAMVSLIIFILAVVLAVEALIHILYEPAHTPHPAAIVCAVISIAANEMIFRYFRCVGEQLRSQTIKAAAWANRADSFSSLAVLVGVVGSQLGVRHLDPIAALVVSAIIFKVCVENIRESLAGLMDRNAPPETLAAVRKVLSREQQVREVRHLRARMMGDKVWVDLAVRVAPGHTVHECESICARLQRGVRESVRGVGHVLVEFEPVEE